MLIDFLGVCLACCHLETCFYHVCCKDQKPKPPTKPHDEYRVWQCRQYDLINVLVGDQLELPHTNCSQLLPLRDNYK